MNSPLDCIICFSLSKDPRLCTQCGSVQCSQCLININHPNPVECIQCSSKNISLLTEELKLIYQELLQKEDINSNQQQNLEQQCLNGTMCNQNISKIFQQLQVCSIECLLFLQIIDKSQSDQRKSIKTVFDQINVALSSNSSEHQIQNLTQCHPLQTQQQQKSLIKQNLDKFLSITSQPQKQPQLQQLNQQNQQNQEFKFYKGGKNIQIVQNKQEIILDESEYAFRSIISDKGFMTGIHYWEIYLSSFTENELKIGVSQSNSIDLNVGFSDFPTGWSYYTIGQLRKGNNSQGQLYGVKLKNKGAIGVLLDMNKGILAYSADNYLLGVAYQSAELKKGPIYPAVALLHKAGFTYQTGLAIPLLFNVIINDN